MSKKKVKVQPYSLAKLKWHPEKGYGSRER
uniref:Uncharacterized protein n=1 Tax=Arundo donax TaxID=35708 RepID=A0A0A8YAX1_ARUDO